jgi:hypothetical protein
MAKDTSVWVALAKMPLPEESRGRCRNSRNCKNMNVILGSGYCVDCWDRGWPHPEKEETW